MEVRTAHDGMVRMVAAVIVVFGIPFLGMLLFNFLFPDNQATYPEAFLAFFVVSFAVSIVKLLLSPEIEVVYTDDGTWEEDDVE